MKFVKNARQIALRSHSMWGYYLIAGLLVAPEILFGLMGVETSPYWVWAAVFIAMLYGGAGRLLDQGIGAGVRPPWGLSWSYLLRILIAGLLIMALMGMGKWPDRPDHSPEVVQVTPDAMFDEVAFDLIAKWEGKRNNAYQDIVGKWTICYGSTRGVRAGMHKTDAECKALLVAEIHEYRDGLHRYLTDQTKASRLPPKRDAAYTSLAYNVGWAGAGRSTAVKRLNAGDIAGGCKALTWWNKAGGRVVLGLVNRRKDEYRHCMAGVS